jgi:hypothetical protein
MTLTQGELTAIMCPKACVAFVNPVFFLQGNRGVPPSVMDSLRLTLMGRQFCSDGLISAVESEPL